MKPTLALVLLVFGSFKAFAYNETDLLKFKTLNTCAGCDLSGADLSNANLYTADLSGADLSGANLTTTNLKNATLDGAIFCRTKMPWGEVNDGC